MQLGAKRYELNQSLALGSRALLVGAGAAATTLCFSLLPLKAPEPPGGTCSSLTGMDLFFHGKMGHDIAYIHNSTTAACCAACEANPSCNAFSYMIAMQQCILKSCR